MPASASLQRLRQGSPRPKQTRVSSTSPVLSRQHGYSPALPSPLSVDQSTDGSAGRAAGPTSDTFAALSSPLAEHAHFHQLVRRRRGSLALPCLGGELRRDPDGLELDQSIDRQTTV